MKKATEKLRELRAGDEFLFATDEHTFEVKALEKSLHKLKKGLEAIVEGEVDKATLQTAKAFEMKEVSQMKAKLLKAYKNVVV